MARSRTSGLSGSGVTGRWQRLFPLLLAVAVRGLNNGMARTPPRGFRTWNQFGLHVNGTLMVELVNATIARVYQAANGSLISLADLGYTDIGVDDGWQDCGKGVGGSYHDATGTPLVSPARFPNMAAFPAYAHAHNLTASWYGNNCWCLDPTTNISHFQGDVAALRAYDFDGYKLDSCGGEQDIQLWSTLLNTSGRAVVIENCHNGAWAPQQPRKPGGDAWCPFNIWRSSTDIWADYGVVFGMNLQTALTASAQSLSFPGCWAYPDMLAVGVTPGLHPGETGLSYIEARSHFNAWCIVSSPLVLGLDIRNATLVSKYMPVIGNVEALAVSCAWAGSAGGLLAASPASNVTFSPCGFWPTCTVAVWQVLYKPLPNGGVALLALNHGVSSGVSITITWSQVPGLDCGAAGCKVRDINAHADVGVFSLNYTIANVTLHDAAFVVVSPLSSTLAPND